MAFSTFCSTPLPTLSMVAEGRNEHQPGTSSSTCREGEGKLALDYQQVPDVDKIQAILGVRAGISRAQSRHITSNCFDQTC